ncbi:MAG: 30S ribosomal protein S16 [Candidatus Vogelbacteria bacterium]|nr:30S ribosomal protein S16 [Candidatus Vogelbacteria bacterium]
MRGLFILLTLEPLFDSIVSMLIIRLQRVGRKNDPSFRVVLTDSKNGPRSGKYLEVLGSYDARKGKAQLEKERVNHWISVGAKVSDTMNNILVNNKVLKTKKINVTLKAKKKGKGGVGSAKTSATPEISATA